MSWSTSMAHWLAYTAVSCFLVLCLATIAVRMCVQPAKRLRYIQWAFLGCLVIPLLNGLPGMPQWHLGWFGRSGVVERVLENPPTRTTNSPDIEVAAAGMPGTNSLDGNMTTADANLSRSSLRVADPIAVVTAIPPRAAQQSSAEPASAAAMTLASVVLFGYAGIGGVLFLWWTAGVLRLRHLNRSSQPATDDLRREFQQIVGDNPIAGRVALRISDRIDMPLTYGWRSPVILMPAAMCDAGNEQQMRYGLAHEWAHVAGSDILPLYLSSIVQVLYFYQPAYWWLRREMRICQDYLADHFAANQSAAPEDYAEFLVLQMRKRMSGFGTVALGFADKKSSLFRRVVMLLENRRLNERCSNTWNIAVGATAVCILLGLASIRLDGRSSVTAAEAEAGQPKTAVVETEKPEEKPEKKLATEVKEKPQSITYTGIVIDRITEKPIPGATVIIDRELSNPPKGMEDFKRSTTAQSDENGKYSFTLAPEEVEQRSLYIEVKAHHPEYAAKGRSGYAHSMILKNLELGEPPFYETIKLWPGKSVSGRVVAPDGTPVADVDIITYSKHVQSGRLEIGGFYKTKSNNNGEFQFVTATPGEGVYWITPAGYAPQAHVVPEVRGDLGNVSLQHGANFTGRVLDAKGLPVPNVGVKVRRNGDGEDVDRFLGQNAVANQIGRQSTTNANGEFQLDELPPGTYRLVVQPIKTGWLHEPLKDVFVPQKLTITEGEDPEPLEIRAVPHVVIHAKFFDSKGELTGGHRFDVFGHIDDDYFFAQSTKPEKKDGLGTLRIPHGMTKTKVNLMTNEHGVLRWRITPGGPLQNSREIDLGTVEDDVLDLEIIRYTAPILLIKAVDQEGNVLRDFQPKAAYPAGKGPLTNSGGFVVGGDLHFEQQPDNRWRSSQLHPNEDVTFTVEMEGYSAEPQVVSLPEGETREIVFTMKKD